ncbi:MAG: RNA-binding S4 domain-containing protein [Clostridia bacterium]|nr:RNA-binding S4 domain-containing protein [Clostridia bacterium]
MRLDKYLKISRLIKRRSVAKDACDSGKISVNDKVAKPGTEVKAGDTITMTFGEKSMTVEVLDLKEHVAKENSKDLYKIIG